jgi:DNA-binding MarR family transcriptional regulator
MLEIESNRERCGTMGGMQHVPEPARGRAQQSQPEPQRHDLAEPQPGRDSVDETLEQWSREWPELDVEAKKVINRVGRVSVQFDRRFKATLAGQDLSYYAFKLLATLRRAGPPYQLTPTELSRSQLVSSGTMTHQIDQLEEAGLVERQPDPSDRRGSLVTLTAAGRERIDRALLANAEDELAAVAALSPEDRATLERLLRKLLRSLEDEDGSAPSRVG